MRALSSALKINSFSLFSIGFPSIGKDRVSREQAGELMQCGTDLDKIEDWCASSPIQVSQLPLGIVGSGNSDLPAKWEGVCHSVKLDIAWDHQSMQRYSQSCVSFLSDFGTEAQIPEAGLANGFWSIWGITLSDITTPQV
jgi:hypothetical protein